MYKDLISYSLAKDIREDRLLSVAQDIIESWMKKQPGFVSWEITKNTKTEKTEYTDIVSWESHRDAKNSEKTMKDIPNGSEWYACYDQASMSCSSVEQVWAS